MLQRVVNKKKRFVRLRLFEYYYFSNIVLHCLGYVFFYLGVCVCLGQSPVKIKRQANIFENSTSEKGVTFQLAMFSFELTACSRTHKG